MQLLTAANVIKGRTLTAYPAVKAEIILAGGKWCVVTATFSNACVDGNIVTAPACPAHSGGLKSF
jgi:protease I